jgi:caa(3)-type oxidase subunit IV
MEKAHPKPATEGKPGMGYPLVFLFLAILTTLEIWLGKIGLPGTVRSTVFLLFSVMKAGLVAAYFMHLRTDSRLYLYIFIGPVLLFILFALLSAVP